MPNLNGKNHTLNTLVHVIRALLLSILKAVWPVYASDVGELKLSLDRRTPWVSSRISQISSKTTGGMCTNLKCWSDFKVSINIFTISEIFNKRIC